MKTKNQTKTNRRPVFLGTALLTCHCLIAVHPASAATDIWNGGGTDGTWQTPGNWGGTPPAAGDALIFQGSVRLNNTNNFTINTVFNGITFNSPAAAFSLFGNQITLTNDLVDNQVVVNELLNLPLALDATHNLNVTANGLLTISNVISGAAGAGITLPGAGRVTLTATNTFTGPVTINNGTLFVSADRNLGAVPATRTAGAVVINSGTLRTGTSFTNNANRGILLGPVGGSGSGTFQVDGVVSTAATLTEPENIANNTGGTGGLTKLGFGGLTLSGTNTYSGPTLDEVGTITLDFTQPTAPAANIINPVSALTLGGANAGQGATNFAALIVSGKTNATSSQSVNGTLVTFGGSVVQAKSLGASGVANLNLGLLQHNPGGTLVAVPPFLLGGNGNITTTATNVNGILGGFATISDGTTVLGIVIGTNFACVDVNGNITNYNAFTPLTTGTTINSLASQQTNNILITSAVTGDMAVDNDNAGSVTDVNAIKWGRTDNTVTLKIGTNNILRLGKYGAIFKPNTTSGLTWEIGEGPTGNTPSVFDQNIGTLTAGGAPNTPGEIIVDANNTSSSSGTICIDAQITDNGTGAVTFVKAGVSSMKLRGHNTYSGGTYLLQGRVQMVGGEAISGGAATGTGNADACGTGPIYILPGAYLFPSGAGPTNIDGTVRPVTNAVFIAGNGTAGEPLGAIRCTGGWLFNGPWTLIGDTTIGGNGGLSGAIGAQLSGPYNVGLCSPLTVNGTVCLTNSANNWSGNTTLNARNNTGANIFLSGNSEIIPNGFGKGNVIMNGFGTGTIQWNLNGFSETVNGLITSGTATSCSIINNSNASVSTLTLGDNDQSGTFGGTIQDGTGQLALTKIGAGVETLSGTANFSGATTVNGGTLALVSAAGALGNSAIQVNTNAVLDATAVNGGNIGSGSGLGLNGGSLFAGISSSTVVSGLGLTNSHVKVILNPATVNVQDSGVLTTGGATNLLDIASIQSVTAYPVQFTAVKYSGSIQGAGFNFGLGALPTVNTLASISTEQN